MKKIFCIVLCACFAFVVLVVPCFAVDWFGSSSVVAYTFGYNNWYQLPSSATPVTIYGEQTFMNESLHDGDIVYFYQSTGVDPYSRISINGSYSNLKSGSTPPDVTGSLTVVQSTYTGQHSSAVIPTPTPVYSGSDGFVDSGFSTALEICGDVVHYILNNTYILVAIGLAVALPLVAWGIGKVKTLIVGY